MKIRCCGWSRSNLSRTPQSKPDALKRMAAGTTTTSPAVVLLTAAAIAGVGIAYWSAESSTSTVGTFLACLRSAGTLRRIENGEQAKKKKNTNDEGNNNRDKKKVDDWKQAFVSWLKREEKLSFSRPRNYNFRNKKKDLADPKWMSETIRTFLRRSTGKRVMSGNKSLVPLEEEGSMKLLESASIETESSQKRTPSPAQPPKDQEETENETAFRLSFQTLQKATEEMIQKEPAIREAFFNGVVVGEEIVHSDEENKLGGRRSLSFSSCSSTWSMGSYEVNEENSLVEEEEEVERLLTYLRFVDLAKESSSSSTLPEPSKSYLSQTAPSLQRQRELIIPDADGYEHLHFETMDISAPNNTQRAKMGYMAALHRDRKELLIAVHYDESLRSSSTIDDRNQIQGILMKSLILQHQDHSETSMVSPPSSTFLLLDKAVKSLFEETLQRYLNSNKGQESEESSSILSSGYSLVLCGHSLGAALVCRLGDMFTRRNKDTDLNPIHVRVYAFGPPPCLPTGQKGSEDMKDGGNDYSYIVSVVNNHDCIPRWTESNLVGLKMSLRWTMDRKQRHFLRYHNRYNQSRSSANPDSESNAMRRQPPRIPPFSVSSMEWNTFWKSSQEQNDTILSQGNDNTAEPKYIVPGKVVLIWNHSQDPNIIGAKVHVSETKLRHPNSSNSYKLVHRQQKESHGVLGRLWVDEGMFSDHTIDSYRSNLELLLGQVGNTI